MDDAKRIRRAEMRRLRKAVPTPHERLPAMWAEVIQHCHRLGAHRVLAFVGVGSEPDTSALVRELVTIGFVVALPRVEGDRMVAVLAAAGEGLAEGAFGIPAPLGPAIDPATIDVVLVPGLAFTPDGRRLGQGGGFYDRFLPLMRPDCVTIGVCFAEQVVDDLETDVHDRNVDLLVVGRVPE